MLYSVVPKLPSSLQKKSGTNVPDFCFPSNSYCLEVSLQEFRKNTPIAEISTYRLLFLKCDSSLKLLPEKFKINNDTKHLHANSDPAYLLFLRDIRHLLVEMC